ncbi:gliding motility-associated lipoprotein GldH [Pedobacter africanus]|uniref:Gliding motility-associated lipoprotein GldH n=1 Tax=Pedobacter africanus TaxID=151894 RepID=A0ACC6L457_9SPHI|nr:gliding motility lipoprotein GldH [Pedobacter africanus]MDR6786078.1 gliding motility-associated lipoprotein GldH [Pedobacter africanus]
MNLSKILFLFVAVLVALSGCDTNNIADTNQTMPSRNWSYANKVKVVVDIKDSNKLFNIYFKLRHTADYRYSNIFVLFNVKSPKKKRNRRYEFKLAQADGQWNGSGSGNLYTYTFPLLTNFKFPAPGKYELELEQNMRDNPLKEISDVGIKVVSVN